LVVRSIDEVDGVNDEGRAFPFSGRVAEPLSNTAVAASVGRDDTPVEILLVEDRDVAGALHDPVVSTVGTLPHQCCDAVCETALAGVGIEIGLIRSGAVACSRSRLRLLRIRRIWKPAVFGIDDKRCLAEDLPRPSMVLPEAVVLVAADR